MKLHERSLLSQNVKSEQSEVVIKNIFIDEDYEKNFELNETETNRNSELKSWDEEIGSLTSFFNRVELTNNLYNLNAWIKIVNPRLFVESHMLIVKSKNGQKLYKPYLDRLLEFKRSLNNAN